MITRRELLSGVAGTAGLLGWPPGRVFGEPPPETTRLRLYHSPGTDWRFLNELKKELKG
jgi:hypothetical protein